MSRAIISALLKRLEEVEYRHEELERRLHNIMRPGRIVPGSQDHKAGTVRIMDGADENDPDGWVSHDVPWKEHSGGISTRTMPTDNQQVVLFSPSGNLEQGWASHGGYKQDDDMPSAPNGETVYRKRDSSGSGSSKSNKDVTITDSQGKRTLKADQNHTVVVGDFTINHDKDGGITISVGGDQSLKITKGEFAFTGGKVTHNGLPIDATHKHKDVIPGGGLSGIPSA